MNKMLAFAFGAALLLSGTVALAQSANAQAPGAKATPTQSMPMTGQMDEHMKKMQTLHDRMMSAATPEERQKAMEEARNAMQEGMAMMKPMMRDGGMMAGKGTSTNADARMQMMGRRLDMMQMMMQMMMDQQRMAAPPGVTGAPQK